MLARPTTPNRVLQRKCACGTGASCEGCKKKELQRKATGPTTAGEVPDIVYDVLRSPGQPLDAATRAYMEPRFGQDFSGVRVHTDAKAAESAAAVDAQAYTVGRQIVFGYGARETKSNSFDLHLLSHELAHTVQQGATANPTGRLAIAEPHSHLESQADRAAEAMSSDASVPSVSGTTAPMIQRSWLGGVLGAIGGAAVGAVGGFLLGGPIGAIAGGLLGGVAGAFVGDALSESGRPLTSSEQHEGECVFGNSINWTKVRVAEAPIMGSMDNARTPYETIYFPPGTLKNGDAPYHWLIHELTHVWQTQHGIWVTTKLWTAIRGGLNKSVYSYGTDADLVAAATAGKKFTSFNTEQQGDIMADYYVRLKNGGDVTPFLPFVTEVRGGAPVTSC